MDFGRLSHTPTSMLYGPYMHRVELSLKKQNVLNEAS